MAVHLTSTWNYRRNPCSRLKPGTLTAHADFRLPLLPSGPDGVHGSSLRKTRFS